MFINAPLQNDEEKEICHSPENVIVLNNFSSNNNDSTQNCDSSEPLLCIETSDVIEIPERTDPKLTTKKQNDKPILEKKSKINKIQSSLKEKGNLCRQIKEKKIDKYNEKLKYNCEAIKEHINICQCSTPKLHIYILFGHQCNNLCSMPSNATSALCSIDECGQTSSAVNLEEHCIDGEIQTLSDVSVGTEYVVVSDASLDIPPASCLPLKNDKQQSTFEGSASNESNTKRTKSTRRKRASCGYTRRKRCKRKKVTKSEPKAKICDESLASLILDPIKTNLDEKLEPKQEDPPGISASDFQKELLKLHESVKKTEYPKPNALFANEWRDFQSLIKDEPLLNETEYECFSDPNIKNSKEDSRRSSDRISALQDKSSREYGVANLISPMKMKISFNFSKQKKNLKGKQTSNLPKTKLNILNECKTSSSRAISNEGKGRSLNRRRKPNSNSEKIEPNKTIESETNCTDKKNTTLHGLIKPNFNLDASCEQKQPIPVGSNKVSSTRDDLDRIIIKSEPVDDTNLHTIRKELPGDGEETTSKSSFQPIIERAYSISDPHMYYENITDPLAEAEIMPKIKNEFPTIVKESSIEDSSSVHKVYIEPEKLEFICVYCTTSFEEDKLLRQHLETHVANGIFICKFCQKLFKDRTNMIRHERVHTGEKPYKCKVCNKHFSLPGNFKKHRDIHDSIRTDPCDTCGRTFKRREHLIKHQRIHTGEKPFACTLCPSTFTARYSLHIHMNNHLGKKPYMCSYCKKRFSDRSTMRKHVRIHTGEKPFECKTCGKTFAESGTLNGHMTTHNNERPFPCEKCELTFKTSSSLRQHYKIHSGIKSYSCKFCGHTFLQKYNLITHERIHTGERPFTCSHCERKFRSKSCLLKHILQTHSGDQQRRYECTQCTKRFFRAAHLRRHIDSHLGIKEFNCTICFKKFTSKASVRNHTKNFHTAGARKFPCDKCGKIFKRQVYVRTHNCSNVFVKEVSENDVSSPQVVAIKEEECEEFFE